MSVNDRAMGLRVSVARCRTSASGLVGEGGRALAVSV